MQKIMFNDKYGLTEAVLTGRKTMTRRIIKGDFEDIKVYHANGGWHFIADTKDGDSVEVKPAYEVGETIAIAQAYQTLRWPTIPGIDWKAITDEVTHSKGWTNKMFVKAVYMPHRIRITDIKVERLQDISDEDCLREGVILAPFRDFPKMMYLPYDGCKDEEVKYYAKPAFAHLIDKVSRKGTWNLNPWVFAYEFELTKL